MSNLKLVADDPTPLEKLLLDASRAELPSEDHKSRMRVLLGIGLPLSGPLAAAPFGAHAQSTGNLAPLTTGVAKSATLAKLGLGLGAVALFGAFALGRQNDAVVPPVAAVRPVIATPVVPPSPTVSPAPEAVPEVSPLPPVEVPTTGAPAARSGRADASVATIDLSEQIRLIEAARAGVAAHDVNAASAALDAYAAKFPRGSFGQEALVLRIRAIDQAGDATRATALAKSFVTRFPNSPHVARLKPIAERGASR